MNVVENKRSYAEELQERAVRVVEALLEKEAAEVRLKDAERQASLATGSFTRVCGSLAECVGANIRERVFVVADRVVHVVYDGTDGGKAQVRVHKVEPRA